MTAGIWFALAVLMIGITSLLNTERDETHAARMELMGGLVVLANLVLSALAVGGVL